MMRLDKDIFLLVSVVITLCIVLGACGATQEPVEQTVIVPGTPEVVEKEVTTVVEVEKVVVATATPEPAPAGSTGELIAVRADEPPTMDWVMGSEPESFVSESIMEALTRYSFESRKAEPVLAESWEWDGANTWTFKLRRGIKFHNGEPFNADAVVYTIQRNQNPDEKAQRTQHVKNILSITAIDEYTVQMTTVDPDPILDVRLQQIQIGEPQFSQEHQDLVPTTPIGTGPYRLVEWKKGEYFKMTANEEYWGEVAEIEDITIIFRAEPAVRAAMVKTGEADLAWIIDPLDISDMPKTVTYENLTVIMIRPDTTGQNPALADVRVRQAMLYAVDTKTAMETMFQGIAVQAKGNQITMPGVTGYDPTMEPWPYDLEKAKALLAEAKADGVPIDTPMIMVERGVGWFPRDNEFAEYLVNAWNEIGLNVSLEVLDSGAWMDWLYSVGPEVDHPDLVYTLHDNMLLDYSRSAPLYLLSNGSVSLWKDETTDQMLATAAQLTGEARHKAYQEASAYLLNKVPIFVFGSTVETHAIDAKLIWTPRPDRKVFFAEMSWSEE